MAIYKEELYLDPLIKWGTIGLTTVAISFGLVDSLRGSPMERDAIMGMTIAIVVFILVMLLLLSLKLNWRMDKSGITYRMFPLEWKERQITWEEVEALEVFKMRFFKGFGGYGRRRAFWRKEIGYIMNRKHAVRVYLKSGRKVVFSTGKVPAVIRYLQASQPDLLQPVPPDVKSE